MFQLRDKSASLGNSIASASSRSMSCVPFTNDRIGSVKFDLPKFEAFKSDKNVGGEKDKGSCDIDVKSVASEINCNKNTISSELDSKSALDSDGRASLSITELNKLKRNAFFNNMDCPNAQSKSVGKLNKEGSSEKVKRVIENFKSEINKTKKDMSEIDLLKSPGKVMELVENFEKKENSNAVCKSKFESGSPEKIVATIKAINDKSYYDKNSGDELGRDELPKCKPKLANDVKEQLIVSTKNETHPFDCSTRFSSSSTESCRVEVKNDGVANAGLRDTSKKYLTDSNIANKENIDTHKKPDDKFTQSVSEVDQISVSNRGHEPEDFRAGKNRTPERTEKDSDETPQMELKKNDFKSEVGTQNVLASTAHSNSAKSTKIDESNKPIPAQRKSKVAFEKNLNSSSTMNPFPLPPKPRTKIPTSLLPDNSVTSTSNIQTPPEPPPRPDNTFLKSVNSKRNESVIESGKQEGKSAMNATRLQPDSSTGKVPFISAPVVTSLEPQPLPLDLKSIPSTPSSPARKLIKPKNAVQSPPSLLNPSSAEKEKTKTSGSTLENLKAMLTLGRKPINVNSPRSIRKKNALLASESMTSYMKTFFSESIQLKAKLF